MFSYGYRGRKIKVYVGKMLVGVGVGIEVRVLIICSNCSNSNGSVRNDENKVREVVVSLLFELGR